MTKDHPDRTARLAEALRANLRRRKAQAREVTDPTPAHQDRHSREDGDTG